MAFDLPDLPYASDALEPQSNMGANGRLEVDVSLLPVAGGLARCVLRGSGSGADRLCALDRFGVLTG